MHSGLELFLRYQSLRSWESDLSQGNLMSHNGNPTMLNGIGLYGILRHQLGARLRVLLHFAAIRVGPVFKPLGVASTYPVKRPGRRIHAYNPYAQPAGSSHEITPWARRER
jgi:hypothetical protein